MGASCDGSTPSRGSKWRKVKAPVVAEAEHTLTQALSVIRYEATQAREARLSQIEQLGQALRQAIIRYHGDGTPSWSRQAQAADAIYALTDQLADKINRWDSDTRSSNQSALRAAVDRLAWISRDTALQARLVKDEATSLLRERWGHGRGYTVASCGSPGSQGGTYHVQSDHGARCPACLAWLNMDSQRGGRVFCDSCGNVFNATIATEAQEQAIRQWYGHRNAGNDHTMSTHMHAQLNDPVFVSSVDCRHVAGTRRNLVNDVTAVRRGKPVSGGKKKRKNRRLRSTK